MKLKSEDAKRGDKVRLEMDAAGKKALAKRRKDKEAETEEDRLMRVAEEEGHLFTTKPEKDSVTKRLAQWEVRHALVIACHGGQAANVVPAELRTPMYLALLLAPRHPAHLQTKLDKLKLDMRNKDENKTVALGTSKINYMDPRITVSWCKRVELPIERVFPMTLRDKFPWAMGATTDFKF